MPIKGRCRIVTVIYDLLDSDLVHAFALGQFPKRLGQDFFGRLPFHALKLLLLLGISVSSHFYSTSLPGGGLADEILDLTGAFVTLNKRIKCDRYEFSAARFFHPKR